MRNLILKTKFSAFIAFLLMMCVLLSSCTSNLPDNSGNDSIATPEKTQPELFEEFLELDFIDYALSNTLILKQLMQEPANFGITGYEASWGDLSPYPSEDYLQKIEEQIAKFRTFDRSKLTPEQQESYDIYAYDVALYEEVNQNYFYYDDPFQSNSGFHSMLPITMSEYTFDRERDIQDYLLLVSKFGELFDMLIQFEKDKSEKGLFMADWIADAVIGECNSFLQKSTDNIMLTSFESRIGKVDFLDDAKKASYIAENRTIFADIVIPTYNKLKTELASLKGTGKNDGGLAGFEKGKDYYRAYLKQLGISKTPEELIALADAEFAAISNKIAEIIQGNPSVLDAYELPFVPELTAEKTVQFWKEKTAADFPSLPDGVTYTLKTIDDTLKDSVAPAFYFIPRMDNYMVNSIYYNPDSAATSPETLFFTLAHEAYPGHLLQKVNVLASSLPNYRKATSYTGYSEGWAQYIESYCHKYMDAGESLKQIKILEKEYDYVLALRLDLGLNYEGWTLEQMTDYIVKNLPGAAQLSASDLNPQYEYYVRNAMKIVPYVAGMYEIRDLNARYKVLLADEYSDLKFHEEFLKRGEAPFALIKLWMDNAFSKDAA